MGIKIKEKEVLDEGTIYTLKDLMGNTVTVRTKTRYLKALKLTLGVQSPAMTKSGVKSRNTIHLWRRDDPAFAALVLEIEESALDMAESSLLSQVREKNPMMTQFFLRTKGKARGYTETVANINLNKNAKDMSSLSDEDLMAIITGEHR